MRYAAVTMWSKADALPVLEVDLELLEHLIRSGSTPQKLALRARILLGAAEGTSNHQLSEELNVSRPTILLWRQRYLDAGLAGVLKDAPRPGRKKMITPEEVDAIVHATLHTTPKDATHWSVRSMAKAQGVSSAMVHRIWRTHRWSRQLPSQMFRAKRSRCGRLPKILWACRKKLRRRSD